MALESKLIALKAQLNMENDYTQSFDCFKKEATDEQVKTICKKLAGLTAENAISYKIIEENLVADFL